MMKIVKVSLLFCLFSYQQCCMSQLRYPIVGAYKKMSAQSMAIWGNNAYLLNKGGYCRILSLVSGDIENEFFLKSSCKTNHSASVCFGNEYIERGNTPVMYIAEYEGKSRCYVESIDRDSSSLVQTIEIIENNRNYRIQCLLVDKVHNFLYAVSGKAKIDTLGVCPVCVRKYRLPKLNEGVFIVLSEKDKIDQFVLNFPYALQDGTIRDDYMYIVTGFQQSLANNPRAKRTLVIIDLNTKSIAKCIDLTYVTTNEPEGFDFYGDKALMFCGQEGGIYEIIIN